MIHSREQDVIIFVALLHDLFHPFLIRRLQLKVDPEHLQFRFHLLCDIRENLTVIRVFELQLEICEILVIVIDRIECVDSGKLLPLLLIHLLLFGEGDLLGRRKTGDDFLFLRLGLFGLIEDMDRYGLALCFLSGNLSGKRVIIRSYLQISEFLFCSEIEFRVSRYE